MIYRSHSRPRRAYPRPAPIVVMLAALANGGIAVSQTFLLIVQNGYGSGAYRAGDTHHVWNVTYGNGFCRKAHRIECSLPTALVLIA